MTAPDRPVEVELKYRVLDLTAAERYLVAKSIGPFVGATTARASQSEDRYVDTADGALARAGFAVRIRQSGRGTVVSVKSTAHEEGAGGSFRREEIEGPADRATPPHAWPASDARSLVLEIAGDAPLIELVTIRQLRRKRVVRDGDTRVELSLDEVDVVAHSRVIDRFAELEAELVKGDEARLTHLADVFSLDAALESVSDSKLEAAMASVRDQEPAAPVEASPRATEEAEAAERAEAAHIPASDAEAGEEVGQAAADADEEIERAAAEAIEEVERAAADAVEEIEHAGADAVEEVEQAAADAVDDEEAAADAVDDEEAAAEEAEEAEIEAEIEAGDDLAAVADALLGETSTEVVPSSSDVVSEAAEDAPPTETHLVVGKSPGVTADDHVAEAARKVLRFHLARMLAREAGTRAGNDPEELHAMRVATRRQRAAWRVFGSSFRKRRTRRYRTGLQEIASRLGAVRDLDVLIEAADHYRSDLPASEQRALDPLLRDWRQHRDDARVLLVRELDSDGYRRWVDDYRDFVRTEGSAVLPVGPTQPHRVRDTTASRIWTAYEQVRGYEPVLRWADVETLHELRIAGKWLRYTLEFVREALGEDAGPLIARVTALQDHLGLMNDADVAASMARTFLVEHAGDLSGAQSAAIGRYLVSREREVARLRRTIAVPWRGVAGIGFRRGLGRVVSGL